MNAKEYLMEIKRARSRITALQEQIEMLRADAENIGISLDGMPRGQSKTSFEDIAIQLAECESKLTAELSALWSKQMEAILILEMLTPKHRTILTEYYIKDKTWERVAYEQGYSWRHCYRLHGYALAELEGVLNDTSNQHAGQR